MNAFVIILFLGLLVTQLFSMLAMIYYSILANHHRKDGVPFSNTNVFHESRLNDRGKLARKSFFSWAVLGIVTFLIFAVAVNLAIFLDNLGD